MRVLLIGILCWASSAALAADHPVAGLYKISGTVTSKQMPISHTNTSEQCIKENQFLEDPQAWMRQQPGQECDVVTYDISNGTIHMKMHCSMDQGGTATIIGNGSYTNTGFQLNNEMTIDTSGMKMEINTAVTGERQGNC